MMAQRVGKRAAVANYLRLQTPDQVSDLKTGLQHRTREILLGVEDPHIQELLCDLVIMTAFRYASWRRRFKTSKDENTKAATKQQDLPDEYYKVLEHIGKFFDNSISLKRSASGKGTMTIKFNSDEEVGRFLKALEDSNI
ncbi:MAG: hypothetical protein ACLVGR_00990 [Anaerovoracaceae bacterium]